MYGALLAVNIKKTSEQRIEGEIAWDKSDDHLRM
jgi:hypothetical protein